MATVPLDEFIALYRDELIRRCRTKVASRSAPPPTAAEINHGVPLFLDQLVAELRVESSQTREMKKSAVLHGHELLLKGFTVAQVVHDYGDICQSITDLAVETGAPISADDFRTLNRCLDDAIAGAVTEYAFEERASHHGTSHELRNLADTAIAAFEVLQTGSVGVTGKTGAVVLRSLLNIRSLTDRPAPEVAEVKPR